MAAYYTTSGSTDVTWTSWNTNTTCSCTTSSSDLTWNDWNITATYSTAASSSVWYYWTAAPERQRTKKEIAAEEKYQEEQRLLRIEREKEYKKKQEQLAKAMKEAEERAKETLKECLDEEQVQMLEKDSFFLVEVKSGNKYRIRKGRTRNIERIDKDNKIVEHLCVHPKIQCPDYDTMLTQKLMLEENEEDLRKVANISRR
jgi:mRNA-degrading endonuclease RelE of RelBE toxin-antitoxin system